LNLSRKRILRLRSAKLVLSLPKEAAEFRSGCLRYKLLVKVTPMTLHTIWIIAQKELRDSLRNRWLWLYTIAFAGLALALSSVSMSSAGYGGFSGFGRTAASLINAVLLFVPLIGLTVGAGTLAPERERGTLTYLMAQPVTRAEVIFGKYLGAVLAISVALSLGFGAAGLALANRGAANAGTYLQMVGLAWLLALAALSIGMLISMLSKRAAMASGATMVVWLVLVFLGDLAVMSAALAIHFNVQTLLGLTMLNPLQVFKVAAIYGLQASLEALGPAGLYAVRTFGSWLMPLLIGWLAIWVVAPLGLTAVLFVRKGDA
jgi:Cu-processing system permease protein